MNVLYGPVLVPLLSDGGGDHVTLSVIALGLAGLGVFNVWKGWDVLCEARRVRQSQPVDVRDVPTEDPPIEFEGRAEPTPEGEPFAAPYSGRKSLCCESRIRNYKDGRPRVVDRTSRLQPFVVDDGTGRVTVDPADATLTDWETVHRGKNPPEGDESSSLVWQKKYQERRIEPGDDVHVYGADVVETTDWGSDVDARVSSCSDTSLYHLTSGEERDAIWGLVKRGCLFLLGGGVACIMALAFGLFALSGFL